MDMNNSYSVICKLKLISPSHLDLRTFSRYLMWKITGKHHKGGEQRCENNNRSEVSHPKQNQFLVKPGISMSV